MNRRLLLLVILISMLGATVTMACYVPPPPPPCSADCSPGFWKNHTEIWEDWAVDEGYDFDELLAGLQGGKDTQDSRKAISNMLNAEFPDAPCDD